MVFQPARRRQYRRKTSLGVSPGTGFTILSRSAYKLGFEQPGGIMIAVRSAS